MAMTAADYLDQLRRLLPTGAAWPRDEAVYRDRVLAAAAAEFARIEATTEALIDEAIHSSVHALLPEWEADYGLPDSCTTPLETIEARMSALVSKIYAETGGAMDPAFYIGLAATMGVEIEITEGIEGDGSTWLATIVGDTDEIHFTAGSAVAGQALIEVSAGIAACLLDKYKPAHTAVVFI